MTTPRHGMLPQDVRAPAPARQPVFTAGSRVPDHTATLAPARHDRRAEGAERAGADIAIDDADRAQHEGGLGRGCERRQRPTAKSPRRVRPRHQQIGQPTADTTLTPPVTRPSGAMLYRDADTNCARSTPQ